MYCTSTNRNTSRVGDIPQCMPSSHSPIESGLQRYYKAFVDAGGEYRDIVVGTPDEWSHVVLRFVGQGALMYSQGTDPEDQQCLLLRCIGSIVCSFETSSRTLALRCKRIVPDHYADEFPEVHLRR